MYHKILLIIFIIIFLINFFNSKLVINEGLNIKNNIVLLGDSIFQNKDHVKFNNSVEYYLKKKFNNALVLAKNNAKIEDLLMQYKQLPDYLDNNNTFLFISIGGNDLLERYDNNKESIYNFKVLNNIFDYYKETINILLEITDCNIILSDLYYVSDYNYHKYHLLVNKWNNLLESFASEKKLDLLKLSNNLYKPIHFINSIEPSKIGSQIIVNNIYKY